MTMARLEEVNTDDDKFSAHDDVFADGTPAVQKMTQQLANPDEAADLGAAVQAVTSATNHRTTRRLERQRERAKLTLPFVPLALPKARPKEVNVDYYRNAGTERCPCDSGTDTRNEKNATHVRGPARSLIAQKMTQFFQWKEFNSDKAVAFGAVVRPYVQKVIQMFSMGTDQSIQTKRSLLDVSVHGV